MKSFNIIALTFCILPFSAFAGVQTCERNVYIDKLSTKCSVSYKIFENGKYTRTLTQVNYAYTILARDGSCKILDAQEDEQAKRDCEYTVNEHNTRIETQSQDTRFETQSQEIMSAGDAK